MIAVIGAGPAGSYAAKLLAEKGKEVILFEEHAEVGCPVQCTGIVTPSISHFMEIPKKIVATECNAVLVKSKNNEIRVRTKEIVMWRNLFDQYVAEKAVDAGATLKTNHQFISISGKNKIKIKNKDKNETDEFEAEAIIGADGPSSSVAKAAGMHSLEQFYVGMQAKIKHKMDTSEFETHFGSAFPDFFGWIVPESEDTVRLGIGAKQNASKIFFNFLEAATGKKDVQCWESGIIPIYNPKKTIQKDNVYLIGDAATQVKATTGGGIIPSLKAATTLTDCIINKKNYNEEFKKQSGRELMLHLRIRNVLNRFKDKDYDHLLSLMSQKRIQDSLSKYDRDSPIALVTSLLLKEPRFLLYGRFAL